MLHQLAEKINKDSSIRTKLNSSLEQCVSLSTLIVAPPFDTANNNNSDDHNDIDYDTTLQG